MRPVQVYANLTSFQYGQLVGALRGPWREATRAVMVLLSAKGMSPTEIAELLDYHPRTVRRWISRHDTEGIVGYPTGLAADGPARAAAASGNGSGNCWLPRRRGPSPASTRRWADPS